MKMNILHLSDIHVWRYPRSPARFFSKRTLGVLELISGRARKFRLERLAGVVGHARSLRPDHILITGDLTTTALPSEFRAARAALAALLDDPARVTIVPGNHDRYTSGSVRAREFETAFGEFAPSPTFPWLRRLDDETALLGLDPTRSHITARGMLPPAQLAEARALVADPARRPRRLIVACHYPLVAPPAYEAQLRPKRLKNADQVAEWLAGIGPHLFCCGHVHAAWAFTPPNLPNQLCLNAGAPLLRDPTGFHLPGFLIIALDGDGVTVTHHAWSGSEWMAVSLLENPGFFARPRPDAGSGPVIDAAMVDGG
jgi:3',5'-cyclic AMP phosphodiesterase CpdA